MILEILIKTEEVKRICDYISKFDIFYNHSYNYFLKFSSKVFKPYN